MPASKGGAAIITSHIRALAVPGATLLALLQLTIAAAGAVGTAPGNFDYYALVLSWSPTYCAGEAGGSDEQQCGPGRRFAFVVHGLWPQFEKGWPQYCDTRERWVPEEEITAMLSVMPSRRLVIHEWRKHGSCSGLGVSDYFARTRTLFAKVRIPARYLGPTADILTTPKQLTADFIKTNRDLAATMISLHCGNRSDRARLSELRICFGLDGAFRQCGGNERRQCRAETLILPRVR
jgi:ribonuclease T2